MRIKIHTNIGAIEIEAKELKLKRTKGFRFFFHPAYMAPGYAITEYSSGLTPVQGKSRKQMVAKLRGKLKQRTKKYIQNVIRKTVKEHGIKYPLNK